MGKVITTWVLDLAESKNDLQGLIADVNTYNTTIAKANQTAKLGLSETLQAQIQVNKGLAAGVQHHSAVTKAVQATTSAISGTVAAENNLAAQTTQASDKTRAALEQNIKKQQALTAEVEATAAATARSKGGGVPMPASAAPVAPALPVAPATAVIGAVPSPSVLAVTQEFERQAQQAKEATVAAQKYLETITASASAAKTAAATANEELKQNKAIFDEDSASLKKLEQQAVTLRAALDKAAPGEQWIKANAALERNARLQAELTDAVQESKDAYEASSRAAVVANTSLQEQNTLQAQAKSIVKESAAAEKELAAAQKEAIAAAQQQARATGLIGAAEEKLTALVRQRKEAQSVPAIQGIDKEIAAVKKEIQAYEDLSNAAPKKSGIEDFFSGLAGKAIGAAAAFFTINKALGLFTDGLKNAAEIAGIKSAFTALAGSVDKGAEEFEYLEQKSNDLGLDLISTASSYKLLFASAKEANLSTEQTRDIFSAITAEGKVLGISNAKLEASLRAVSQMLGKGVVSSEELRRQLGEALPDATAQAAKALGVTTSELDKMLRKGQVISSDFLPKFAAQIQKTYGGATADAATQLQANLNRISNAYKSFTAGLVTLFAPVIAGLANLTKGFESQATIAERSADAFQTQKNAVNDLVHELPDLVKEGDELQKKTNLNTKEQERLAFIISTVAKTVPGAVTAFDEYGKALGYNSDAVTKFLNNNVALSRRLRDAALRENQTLLDQLEAQQKGVIEKLNDTVQIGGISRLQQTKTSVDENIATDYKEAYSTQEESDKESIKLGSENLKLLEKIAAVRAKIQEIATGGKDPNGNGADAAKIKSLGIILDLQKKIADLTEARSKVVDGPVTKENPNGGGAAKIDDYTAQIKKAQKELDDYLGKEGKKVADGRAAALKALLAEELRLRNLHEKAVIDDLKDAGQARAAEQLRQDFNEIAATAKHIIELEKIYATKGGKGADADGKLNKEQQDEVNNYRLLAVKKFNEEIARIDREANQQILDLQAESDEKELAQLRAKFAEQIRVAEASNEALGSRIERAAKAGNQTLVLSLAASKSISDDLLKALKEAAEQQENLLKRQQALNAIDMTQKAQTDSVNVGQIPITQTSDVTADNSAAEQEGAAKRITNARNIYEKLFTLETDLEAQKQKKLLEIQIAGNNARLAQYENDFTKEGIAIKAGLIDANKGLVDELNKVKVPEKRSFNLARLLGVAKEDQDQANEAFANFYNGIVSQANELAQQQLEAANKVVDQRKADVQEKQKDLDQEIDLNKQGFASNVETKRAELAEAKKQRAEAIADQKKAQKQQAAVETATQVSGLITSSVNIFQGFSLIPIIGPLLGAAAIAAMFALFIKTKANAAGLASKFEKGGWIGGKRHSEGGNKFVSLDGEQIEHEKGEFVVEREAAKKHANILEAINADDEKAIASLAVKHLLKGTGVRLALDGPTRLENKKTQLAETTQRLLSGHETTRLERIEAYLRDIKNNTFPRSETRDYGNRTETHEGNRKRVINKG